MFRLVFLRHFRHPHSSNLERWKLISWTKPRGTNFTKINTVAMTDGIFPLLLSALQQNWILYSFFWVVRGRLNFICRRFETSETLANKIQTPENYLKERIQRSQHGESLKSRNIRYVDDGPNMKLYKNPLNESGTVTYKQMEG